VSGRFAPSPTGDLHLGNLRTALLAAVVARWSGRGFLIRMEDLDRVTSSPVHEARQLADLAAIGVTSDPPDAPVVRQSDRFDLHRAAIARLGERGLVYPCFCTRREIRAEIESAASAPHAHLPDGAYPGTCRDLSESERARRMAEGRRPALRLRTDGEEIAVVDRLAGEYRGVVDDVVLARADGVPSYNLAVVVDDATQGVTQVVRGDDLLASTPRQVHLQRLLGLPSPEYWHVGLVLGPSGDRLAKRDGAVTLADLAGAGVDAGAVRSALARSLGLTIPHMVEVDGFVAALASSFAPDLVPAGPITVGDLRVGPVHGPVARWRGTMSE
jgi:glutamyl-tRNA synthetase